MGSTPTLGTFTFHASFYKIPGMGEIRRDATKFVWHETANSTNRLFLGKIVEINDPITAERRNEEARELVVMPGIWVNGIELNLYENNPPSGHKIQFIIPYEFFINNPNIKVGQSVKIFGILGGEGGNTEIGINSTPEYLEIKTDED